MPKNVIIFSGGGSSGHLMPSLAVADAVTKKNPAFTPLFICSSRADEVEALTAAGQKFVIIHAGKFPRGFSPRIISFPFLFVISFIESLVHVLRTRPVLIMSKGGFVSVPVCLAGFVVRVPVVLHSSDSVPSLSDRIIGRIARTICTGFPESAFPTSLQKKAVQTGNPVRPSVFEGSHAAGQRITGFSGRRPVLMIIGGSQGSVALNEAIEKNFQALLDLADIIHLTGEGKMINRQHARYFPRTTVLAELPHLYGFADLVVTRAGAGVLSELAALKKAAIVVPLPGVAHDHQVKNAEFLATRQAVEFLAQDRLSDLPFVVSTLLGDSAKRAAMGEALSKALPANAAAKVAEMILDVLAPKS